MQQLLFTGRKSRGERAGARGRAKKTSGSETQKKIWKRKEGRPVVGGPDSERLSSRRGRGGGDLKTGPGPGLPGTRA